MVLYRYFGIYPPMSVGRGTHAFDTLRDARLLVSSPNSFNDPFECMYRPIGRPTIEGANADVRARIFDVNFLEEVRKGKGFHTILEAQVFVMDNVPMLATALYAGFDRIVEQTLAQREKIIEDSMRVVCFSADTTTAPNEILLWSHYAQKHHGARIGFQIPMRTELFSVQQVEYSDERVAVDMSDFEGSQGVQDAIKRSLRTKSKAWEYEQEYRLMTTPTLCEKGIGPDKDRLFISIRRDWVKRVDIGARCDPDVARAIVDLARREYPSVLINQARYHGTEYSLEYQAIP